MSDSNLFLIIGAQKAGTTSLFNDLQALSGIELPDTKERGWFNDDKIYSSPEQRRFHRTYRSEDASLRGDVSTSYAKRDQYPGVPERVRAVLGPATRIVYLLREPIERTISHHHFESDMGLMPVDFSESLETHPELVNNSRYGYQLQPWLSAFPKRQILIVDFHSYVADRLAGVQRVAEFLGYGETVQPSGSMGLRHNPTQGRKSPTGLIGSIVMSQPYRRAKRRVPKRLRTALKDVILSESATDPIAPSNADIASLTAIFATDRALLISQLGSDGRRLFKQAKVTRP